MSFVQASRFWIKQPSGLTLEPQDPELGIELFADKLHETEVGSSLVGILQAIDAYYLFPEMLRDLETV